jgi:hypothetical protein
MAQPLAVAVIHGIGKQDKNFAEPLIRRLWTQYARLLGDTIEDPDQHLVIEPVFWQPCIQSREDTMWDNLLAGGPLDWQLLRRFFIDFAGDAIAYQQTPGYVQTYNAIHGVMAKAFNQLAERAGEKAPLCVIAHSLGSIISSNYLYDLQTEFAEGRGIIAPEVKAEIDNTPLEHGETLCRFFTMGSPLAVWSLRYEDFGSPVKVPALQLAEHWPGLSGEWTNIFDRDDIIGYPLKSLNAAYDKAVTEDLEMNVGGLFKCWNPACHLEYWADCGAMRTIARSLARAWRAING